MIILINRFYKYRQTFKIQAIISSVKLGDLFIIFIDNHHSFFRLTLHYTDCYCWFIIRICNIII